MKPQLSRAWRAVRTLGRNPLLLATTLAVAVVLTLWAVVTVWGVRHALAVNRLASGVGDVIFYGLDEHVPAIDAHRQDGGRAVFLRQDGFVMAFGRDEVAVLPPSCLPSSDADRKEAVLAAIGAGWAMGLSPDLIGAALRTFEWNTKKN